MDAFDQIVQSATAHQYRAQIILEEEPMGNNLEQAIEILKLEGLAPSECIILKENWPRIVQFILPGEDMRLAIKKLSEYGFTRLHGINRIPDPIKFKSKKKIDRS